MNLITHDKLETEIRHLKEADLDDAEFVEQLAELMATASDASHHWILNVSAEEIEVLADREEDIVAYQRIAARHHDFGFKRELAIVEKQTTMLRLEKQTPPGDALPQPTQESGQLITLPPALPLESTSLTPWKEDETWIEHTDGQLFFVPVRSQLDTNIVICLFSHPFDDADMNSMKRQLTLLSMLGDLRANTAQTKAIELASAAREVELRKALDLSSAVSGSLEKEKSAFVIANELQNYLEIDRVTILDQVGKKSQVLAVSGQPSFDRRANVVRYTQTLVRTVLKSGEPFWFDGDPEQLAKPIQKAVGRYVDESLVQNFAIIPIHESKAPYYRSEEQSLVELVNPGRTEKKKLRGAILLESIQTPIDREVLEQRLRQVQPQVTSDFVNAKKHSDLFLLPMMSMMTKFAAFYRGHTARIAWGLTLGLIMLVMAGFLIQVDFLVRCEGYLQPEKMDHVFVRKDGIVMNVLVKEGEDVKQGDPLVTLQNRELEFELASLAGELEEKLAARKNLIYNRLDYLNNPAAQKPNQNYSDLAEQTGLLESQIKAIEKNLELKKQQQEDLVVRAPFDGQVMGWNVDRKFLNRPLDQGTRLFSIAKNDEQRILELKVPDQRSGYVTTAWREDRDDDEKLQVEFSIASFPEERFEGEVTHLNPGLEQDSDLGYVLPLEARPSSELPADLRSGIPVVAKVVCGRRSFIFCKTYEFKDWFHRTVFEYFF